MCATVAVLAAAPAQAAPRRVVVAFADRATLRELAALPGASAGWLSPTQGRYDREQALLDISQGTRTSRAAYRPPAAPPLRVGPGRVLGWPAVVRRADRTPAEIVPGLLGSSVPGGAAFAGRPLRLEAIAAADRAGRFGLGDRARLVVTVLPGASALRALVRRRVPGELVIAMLAPPPGGPAPRLLPVAIVGLGGGRELRSVSTNTDGLVAGIDVLPTALRWLGRPVPRGVTGQPATPSGPPLDVAGLEAFSTRLQHISPRRLPALGALAAGWALLAVALAALGGRAGLRRAGRAGGLALLWLLPVLLADAAIAPAGAIVEEAGVAVTCLALGLLTDALVRWPRAPLVPAAAGVLGYVADLVVGGRLIALSLLGPIPLQGTRFYGIGNELEATLPVLMLAGIAAAVGPRPASRTVAWAFAAGGVVLGVAMGAGRLGADVGGVITVGAATATAVVLSLPGDVTRRRVTVALAVPAAALAALVAIDLVTGGDSHLTRTVLHADSSKALGDVVKRRYALAWGALKTGAMPVLTPLALAAIAVAVARRRALLAGVPGAVAWRAALAGSAAGGIAGTLFNDSGPVLLVYATVLAGAVCGYLRFGARSPG